MDVSDMFVTALCSAPVLLLGGVLLAIAWKRAGRWLEQGHTITVSLPAKDDK